MDILFMKIYDTRISKLRHECILLTGCPQKR